MQRVRRAVAPPGRTRQDWEIVSGVARMLGLKMEYAGPDAIMRELAGLTPIYGGISFERIEGEGLQWP